MKKIFTDGAMLLTCLLMLAAIAITKNKRVGGHDLTQATAEARADSTSAVSQEGDTLVVNTTMLTKDVVGYGGPVPLKIYLADDRIARIEVLRNAETPEFIGRVEQELLSQYVGKTAEEASALHVDAVSGATMSSGAVIKNMQRGLGEVKREKVKGKREKVKGKRMGANSSLLIPNSSLLIPLSSLLVALLAAIVPLFYKKRVYRLVQLALNVVVLGFYTGTFVSYTSVVSVLSNGITWSQAALGVLLVVAFLYPLVGRKGYYCAWCCPLGSAQELMGKTTRRKVTLSPAWVRRLTWLRQGLWCVLMLLAWTGVLTDWMDYELFSAFIWQSASWVLLAFAVVVLLLSVVVVRPYCRFLCPTGTLLKSL